jgi:glycosyltransferase involved in cell wall biosynthesis
MKRIGLYLGFLPTGGGAFQYAQAILAATAALPLTRYQVVVAYTHSAWESKLVEYSNRITQVFVKEAVPEAVIRTALRMGFPLTPWRALAGYLHPLSRRLLQENCVLWISPAQEVWTYALPLPTLGVIHDLMHRYERHFPEVSRWGLFRRRERHYRRICAKARGILVDSELGKCQVMDSYGLTGERIHILPFTAPPYIYNETIPDDFEQRYPLPEKFIFYPAQFWQHKNHIRLLQALASIHSTISDLHLVLVGSRKNAYPMVVQAIDQLQLRDRVHIFDYIRDEDIPTFYRRARALIMPTFFGPTNIPPLEAMAVGCPMAVSNVYAMPEQVGDAALLFDPQSVGDIAQAIFRLATDDDLCRRLSVAGKVRAMQWGQRQFNECFHAILESVMDT